MNCLQFVTLLFAFVITNWN